MTGEQQPTEEEIQAAKTAAGVRDLIQIDLVNEGADIFHIIAMIPTKIEWAKYRGDMEAAQDEARKMEANETIVCAMAKWPDRETIKSFFSKMYLCSVDAVGQLNKEVGGRAEARSKKL